jgi:hypothetical protein
MARDEFLQQDDSGIGNEVSIRWLLKSIAYAIFRGLIRNKLASILAFLTAAALIVLTVNSRFDGLHNYQEVILPRLLRLETGFINSLRYAETDSTDWRAYYFENAHQQVKDILRAASLAHPKGYAAQQKHREFVRYYESLNLAFYSVGMQLRVNPDLDYLTQLKNRMKELKPIRDDWARWVESNN